MTLRCVATIDYLGKDIFNAEVRSEDLPGIVEFYTFKAEGENLAAQEAIRRFIRKHSPHATE